jgi:hypothetical protein
MFPDALIVALVPGLVEVAKRTGLPNRYGAAAAIILAVTIAVLSHAASNPGPVSISTLAGLILTGLVNGLAAVGLFRLTSENRRASGDSFSTSS